MNNYKYNLKKRVKHRKEPTSIHKAK